MRNQSSRGLLLAYDSMMGWAQTIHADETQYPAKRQSVPSTDALRRLIDIQQVSRRGGRSDTLIYQLLAQHHANLKQTDQALEVYHDMLDHEGAPRGKIRLLQKMASCHGIAGSPQGVAATLESAVGLLEAEMQDSELAGLMRSLLSDHMKLAAGNKLPAPGSTVSPSPASTPGELATTRLASEQPNVATRKPAPPAIGGCFDSPEESIVLKLGFVYWIHFPFGRGGNKERPVVIIGIEGDKIMVVPMSKSHHTGATHIAIPSRHFTDDKNSKSIALCESMRSVHRSLFQRPPVGGVPEDVVAEITRIALHGTQSAPVNT